MKDKYVAEVRAFNRFYTVFMGILNKSFLNSKYSLPETRVMHAVYVQPGITAKEIVAMLRVDKSYLSRMIMALEKKKLISREQSEADARAVHLYITAFGKKEFEKLDATSDQEVGKMLETLTDAECRLLTKSMSQIRQVLEKSS